MLQAAVDRLQELVNRFVATLGMHPLQLFERYGAAQIEGTSFGSAQLCNVCTATQQVADIFDQSADIGAFAAIDRQARLLRLAAQ